MNKTWMILILSISALLLLILKTHERRSLSPYFKAEPSIRLSHFADAKLRTPKDKIHLLELWESMLTGRVAPLDRWLRVEYKTLALAHVFTPSGFHLSALLWPLLLLFRKKKQKITLLSLIGAGLSFVPGQSALKRMTSIKLSQQFFGPKAGFLLALFLDILFGSFTDSPLGFTYSFLFLGIIYSGARGATLFIWFFLAQLLIAFIQGSMVSPLLLITSPIVNSLLALVLPVLFILSWPLAGWQLSVGLFLLEQTQTVISFFYSIVMKFPLLDANVGLLLFFIFVSMKHGREAVLVCLLLSADLNHENTKIPVNGSYEWQAKEKVIKVSEGKIYREDGICKRELVKGVWFETCSPRKTRRAAGKSGEARSSRKRVSLLREHTLQYVTDKVKLSDDEIRCLS